MHLTLIINAVSNDWQRVPEPPSKITSSRAGLHRTHHLITPLEVYLAYLRKTLTLAVKSRYVATVFIRTARHSQKSINSFPVYLRYSFFEKEVRK